MNVPQRILVIKLRAIGDVVMATPVLDNLRHAFPCSTIDFLTETFCAPIVKRHPAINEAIEVDKKHLRELSFARRLAANFAVLKKLRKKRYDLVFDLFGNPRTAIMTLATGAPQRVGFRFRGRRHAYNIVVEPRGNLVHEVEFNLDALRALGIPVITKNLAVPLEATAESTAETFYKENNLRGRIIVGLNGSGGWYTKRWPLDRFAALGDKIAEELGAAILLIWGPGEYEDARSIAAKMRHKALLIPESDLILLSSLLRRLTVLVSNDSGPLHIAAAVGTPVAGIYGPTRPDLQGPWGEGHQIVHLDGLACLGCNGVTCRIQTHDCMQRLEVDAVFRSLERCLGKIQLAGSERQAQP
jgi:lipopolysaccharide heptosyltransferase II